MKKNYSLIVICDNCITGIDKLIAGYGFVDNRRRAMDKCMDSTWTGELPASCHPPRSPAGEQVTHKLHNHYDLIMSMMMNNEFSRYLIT